MGCDDHHVNKIFLHGVFQSTHPGWGATKHNVDTIKVYKNFNPRTPGGVRRRLAGAGNAENKFQSTHPGWGATRTQAIISGSRWDFNPRTPGGVRLQAIAEAAGLKKFQSTHPGWGATAVFLRLRKARGISIHAPRVGCDTGGTVPFGYTTDFNPRTPGGVRRRFADDFRVGRFISIHAPRVGCDRRLTRSLCCTGYFNPRTPGGVRPFIRLLRLHNFNYFNPRTPGGVRLIFRNSFSLPSRFQSTHPGWGATIGLLVFGGATSISIHAPRVGCDSLNSSSFCDVFIFQSTHPGWGATAFVAWKVVGIIFQSTHPGWGATGLPCPVRCWQ